MSSINSLDNNHFYITVVKRLLRDNPSAIQAILDSMNKGIIAIKEIMGDKGIEVREEKKASTDKITFEGAMVLDYFDESEKL